MRVLRHQSMHASRVCINYIHNREQITCYGTMLTEKDSPTERRTTIKKAIESWDDYRNNHTTEDNPDYPAVISGMPITLYSLDENNEFSWIILDKSPKSYKWYYGQSIISIKQAKEGIIYIDDIISGGRAEGLGLLLSAASLSIPHTLAVYSSPSARSFYTKYGFYQDQLAFQLSPQKATSLLAEHQFTLRELKIPSLTTQI